MSEEPEIKGVIPSYYGFLITGITALREYWARKQYVEALDYAMELTNFLPTKIKDQLTQEKEEIKKKLTNIPVRGNTLYALQRSRSKQAYSIATRELEPFVDKIIRLLDKEHLLTQQYGVPTRKGSLAEIGKQLE